MWPHGSGSDLERAGVWTCSAASLEQRCSAVTRSAKTGHSAEYGTNATAATPAVGIVDLFAGIGCVADGFAAKGFEPAELEEAVRRFQLRVADDVELACEREAERLVEGAAALGVGDADHRVQEASHDGDRIAYSARAKATISSGVIASPRAQAAANASSPSAAFASAPARS